MQSEVENILKTNTRQEYTNTGIQNSQIFIQSAFASSRDKYNRKILKNNK